MRLWPEAVYDWGSTAAERAEPFPCDRLIEDPGETLFRALDIDAPAARVFRWLCQLRAAPYSYDLVDNFGRRSPRRLTPGLERLERGQPVMRIFRLVDFEPDCSLTISARTTFFGDIACSYRVRELEPGQSRLVAKLLIAPGGRLRSALAHTVLAPGDLLMMRRQLLNLAELAERGS